MAEKRYWDDFFKDEEGQLSLFSISKANKTSSRDPDLDFIEDLHQELVDLKYLKEKLESLTIRGLSLGDESKFFSHVRNSYHVFFSEYFTEEKICFYDYLLKKYKKEFSKEYYLFSQLVLDYLNTFVYNHSDLIPLGEEEITKLENFALSGFIPQRGAHYKEIVTNIRMRRQKKFQDLSKKLKDQEVKEEVEEIIETNMSISISKECVKEELENFLNSIFIFPVYEETQSLNEFKMKKAIFNSQSGVLEREAFILAMEYLERFVYSVSEDYLVLDPKILTLENYIVSCEKRFPLSSASLCLAKSILFKRESSRTTLNDLYLLKKVLKTR